MFNLSFLSFLFLLSQWASSLCRTGTLRSSCWWFRLPPSFWPSGKPPHWSTLVNAIHFEPLKRPHPYLIFLAGSSRYQSAIYHAPIVASTHLKPNLALSQPLRGPPPVNFCCELYNCTCFFRVGWSQRIYFTAALLHPSAKPQGCSKAAHCHARRRSLISSISIFWVVILFFKMHFFYVTFLLHRASQSTEVTLDLPPPGAPMGTSNMCHEERRKKMENKQACTKKIILKWKAKQQLFFFPFPLWINCTFPIPTSNYLCPPQTPLLSIYVCRLQRICRHRCAAHSSRRYRRMCWVRHFIIFSSWRKPLNLWRCAVVHEDFRSTGGTVSHYAS